MNSLQLGTLGCVKNILVNCMELSFTCLYSHVRAHQDDKTVYQDLS
jgi:hypothetical protein